MGFNNTSSKKVDSKENNEALALLMSSFSKEDSRVPKINVRMIN